MPERMITFEIKEHIGTITHFDSGWSRELNLVSWNGGHIKYDIRDWDDTHTKMSKGMTFHIDEMRRLVDMYLADNSRRAVERGKEFEAARRERRAESRQRTDGPGPWKAKAAEETEAAPTVWETDEGSEDGNDLEAGEDPEMDVEMIPEEDPNADG